MRCVALLAGVLILGVPAFAYAAADPFASRQWGLDRIHAEQAWSTARGAGTTIAIVDTGVDLRHPDLQRSFVPGYDFVDGDADAMDEEGHGTHVAGIAAARAANGIGVAGVAPAAKIMPVRVLDEEGRGTDEDVEAGVRWAVEHGADVVNLSISDDVVVDGLSAGFLSELARYAWSKGVITVISAGNGGLVGTRTDPSDAKAFLVTATDKADTRAPYARSVGFADWGIAAPGGDGEDGDAGMIFSTYWSREHGSGYGWGEGTSMAAPHVSGAAAILRGLGLTAQQTVDRLLSTAKDIGPSGEDFTYGHGLVDVAAAVKGLKPPSDPAPARTASTSVGPSGRPVTAATASTPRPGPAATGTAPATDAAGEREEPTARPRVIASEETSERSAVANIVLATGLLGAAAALVGFESLRRLRARR